MYLPGLSEHPFSHLVVEDCTYQCAHVKLMYFIGP